MDQNESIRPFLLQASQHLDKFDVLEEAQISTTVNYLLFEVARLLAVGIKKEQHDPHGFDHTVRNFFQGLEASRETAAEPWTVVSIANACRVGTTYLNTACKRLFNSTPSDQVCRIRLAHAARMLEASQSKSVTEIAFAVGFNSSQYFATRFRRQYGCTPKQYCTQSAS